MRHLLRNCLLVPTVPASTRRTQTTPQVRGEVTLPSLHRSTLSMRRQRSDGWDGAGGGWWTEMTNDEIACGGPSPASMRGGALVGAFDHRDGGAETHGSRASGSARARDARVFMYS